MVKHFSLFLCFLFSLLQVDAQEQLHLADAISMALKNNYSIVISKNEAEISTNNNTPGNAGMLPLLNLNGAGNKSVNNTKQNYSNGLEVNRNNVQSNSLSAGAALEWTLFNGFKMFATRSKLLELQNQGALLSKIEIENTVLKIIASYFDIVRHKELVKADQNALAIYSERARIAEAKYNVGSSSKLEVLQAKVDLNAQRSAQLKEQTALYNSKVTLNQLLGRTVDTDFDAADSIVITYQPKPDDLKKTFAVQNNSLLAAQRGLHIASYTLKEIESQRYPQLNIGANYNFSRVENQVGFLLLNQNLGLNYGFHVTWNIFNGLNISRQVKNAKLDYQNSALRLNDVKSLVESAVLQGFRNFEDALELLRLEEDNLLLARENVTVGMERFRIGKSIQLELQEAQKSLEDAENRTTSARYDAKIAETELMRLNGELVK